MAKFKNISSTIGKYIIGCIILLIYGFLMFFGSVLSVHAESINSVAVMYDLYEDKTFNKDDYPSVDNDYALYVMQIGESDKKELFIYAYQPSNNVIDLVGSSVSISYGFSKDGLDLHPLSYDLELISTNGVFDKYYVKDFVIPNDGNRFYNIVSISRKFNSVVDTSIDMGETTEIAYSVGQQWCCYDINNSVKYEMVTFETLEVDVILNETWYFPDGFTLVNLIGGETSCDVWTIFFNVDEYVIKHIYDADLTFDKRSVEETWRPYGTDYVYSEWERYSITLSDEDVCNIRGDGIFGKDFSWNRIESSKNFVDALNKQNVEILDSTLDLINKSSWAFTYCDTEHLSASGTGFRIENYYEISNVGILRLHFLDNRGKQYDLGVVSDKSTADNIYGGYGGTKLDDLFDSLGDWFEKLFAILGIVILVIVLVAISGFITPVWKIICLLFKALWYVISLPFRLIAWAFKRGN